MMFPRTRLVLAQLRTRLWYWGRIREWPPATTAMLLINCIVFAVIHFTWSSSPEVLFIFGAFDNQAIWQGQVWRLVTPMFLHAGWVHLLTNMAGLYLFCGEVERSIGSLPWLLVYFCCGIAACAASGVLPPDAMSVGASGAIYGVMGIFLAAHLCHVSIDGVLRLRSRALGILLLILVALELAFSEAFSTDVAGHFGGLMTGLWFAFLILPARRGYTLGALRQVRIHPVLDCHLPTNGSRPTPISPLSLGYFGATPVWQDNRWDRRKLAIGALGGVLLTCLVAYALFPLANPRYQLHQTDQLAMQGKLKQAARNYQPFARMERFKDEARFRLAVLKRMETDYAQAWVHLDPLVNPSADILKDPSLVFQYWVTSPRAGQRSKYLEELSRLSEHAPEPRRRLDRLVETLPTPETVLARSKELRAVPRFEIYNSYAWVLALMGRRLPEALKYAQKSVALDRNFANLDTLGWVQAKLKRLPQAETSLRESLTLFPYASVHYHLAQVLLAAGRTREAVEHLRATVRLHSDRMQSFAETLQANTQLRRLSKKPSSG